MRAPRYVLLFWFGTLFCIDQLLKYYVLSSLAPNETLPILSFLSITATQNHGVTLSFFSSPLALHQYVLSLIALGCLLLIHSHAQKYSKNLIGTLSNAALWAGGLSNLFDRIVRGGVIDYLILHIGPFYWPAVLNLADLLICAGLFGIFMASSTAYHAKKAHQEEHPVH